MNRWVNGHLKTLTLSPISSVTRQQIMSLVSDMSTVLDASFSYMFTRLTVMAYLSYGTNVRGSIRPKKSLRTKLDICPNVKDICVPYPQRYTYLNLYFGNFIPENVLVNSKLLIMPFWIHFSLSSLLVGTTPSSILMS